MTPMFAVCPKHEEAYDQRYGCQECRRGNPPKGGSSTVPPKGEEIPRDFKVEPLSKHAFDLEAKVVLPGKYAVVLSVDGTTVIRTFQTLEEVREFENETPPIGRREGS